MCLIKAQQAFLHKDRDHELLKMLCIAWNTCIVQFPFTIIVACRISYMYFDNSYNSLFSLLKQPPHFKQAYACDKYYR